MAELKTAPVLSTPAENLFDQVEPVSLEDANTPRRTDEELRAVYEIARTAQEIRAGNRKCVALQFPDAMLGDSPRVVKLLREELAATPAVEIENAVTTDEKIYILADTSYSACCVDEVAAEHADADVVVHYGRSCLSPTSRLPVIYVFTQHALNEDEVVQSFAQELGAPKEGADSQKVVIMADVTYQDHVVPVAKRLRDLGYKDVLATKVVHRPLGSIPNRAIVGAEDNAEVDDESIDLHEYAVFHIAQPPMSLLLALAARVKNFFIYSTTDTDTTAAGSLLAPRTMGLLGRRYAKVLTMATAGVIGILVNTLSVNNYLKAVDAIRKRIADAGKKSYLIVVGKLNPVKLANFAEIEGWVVVGCWESSLVEDDAGFYQPVVTPFELEMALMSDGERIWGHKWWGGLEALTSAPEAEAEAEAEGDSAEKKTAENGGDVSDEEESEVPQFNLRTGRLVTTSRPMRNRGPNNTKNVTNGNGNATEITPAGGALALRQKPGELATIKGVVSPGAEYLRSQRTWQGLGTEFDDEDVVASTDVEEGRSGIARGYTVGEEAQPRT